MSTRGEKVAVTNLGRGAQWRPVLCASSVVEYQAYFGIAKIITFFSGHTKYIVHSEL